MSEQRTQQQQQQQKSGSPLQTERGSTKIEDAVVSKVAGIAAQEVEGVQMGAGASRAIGGLLGSMTSGSGGGETRGVTVEVGEVEAAVDLTMAVEYGKSIPQVSEAVRRNVVNRVENLVGLNVTEVNITINDVIIPQQNSQEDEQRQREIEREQQAAEEKRVR